MSLLEAIEKKIKNNEILRQSCTKVNETDDGTYEFEFYANDKDCVHYFTGKTLKELKYSATEIYNDFDVDKECEFYIKFWGLGNNGVPRTIIGLYEDIELEEKILEEIMVTL